MEVERSYVDDSGFYVCLGEKRMPMGALSENGFSVWDHLLLCVVAFSYLSCCVCVMSCRLRECKIRVDFVWVEGHRRSGKWMLWLAVNWAVD